MSLSRLHRLVLFSTLGLLLLLASAPSVSASSPNHTEQGLPSSTCPGITLFTPGSGPVGTSVTITGCGFTRATNVTFNGVAASFTVNLNRQITATVPGGATSGAISVTTPTRTVTSTSPFMVTPAVTLSPTVGPPTSTVGVSGTTFGSTEAVDVYFDTIDEALAATTVQGAFAISIQVPGAAVPGTHWVTAVGRHSGLSAQAAFLVQTDWAQFHNNPRRTGSNPYENVLSPAKVASLDVAWSAVIGSSIFSSPAVADGVVYVGSGDDHLYAFNAQTGAQLWSAATGSTVFSSPAVADGVVYIGSEDDHLYAFNAQTGAQLWSAVTGSSIFSSPAVANGVVYVGSFDKSLYAYALPAGEQLKPVARPNPARLHPNLKLRIGS